MSTLYKKPPYSTKQQENNWINNIYHSHDLWCGCKDPELHFLTIINRNGPTPKPEKDIRNIQCLLTGSHTTTVGEEDGGLEEGELEKLFAEDGPDDTG